MKKLLFVVLCASLWLVPGIALYAQGAFSDVPIDHWAYEAIQKLADLGCLIGYPDGMMKGQRAMTRYEAALMVARCCEKCGGGGVAGPKGEVGPAGPAGPPGPPGTGAGLTDQQKALLQRLETEFAPELKAIRADLDDLTRRVEELEAKPAEKAKVAVSGSLQYRAGYYGSKLAVHQGLQTGYPYDLTGLTQVGWFDAFGVPVTDSTKDAWKAGDFSSLRTIVTLSGQVAKDAELNVRFLADPSTNEMFPIVNDVSPNVVWNNGNLDMVRIDEAYVKVPTTWILPVDWVVGKQRVAWGQGLVLDNNLLALKGVDAKVKITKNIGLEAFGAMLDREALGGQTATVPNPPGVETVGQDDWAAARLSFPLAGWNLGVNWLQDGFRKEKAGSIDLAGKIFGRNVALEWAELRTNAANISTSDIEDATGASSSDKMALLVKADILKTSSIDLSASYGRLGALYAFAVVPGSGFGGYDPYGFGPGAGFFNLPFSALHPYAEVNAHDINWVDRPLFLDPTNIAKGFQLALTLPKLLGQGTPLTFTWADGEAINHDYLDALAMGSDITGIDKWRDADRVWTVSITRPLAENVNFRLLYGQRQVENVLLDSPDDDIKVLRGELTVTF